MADFFINGFSALTGAADAASFAPYFEARRLRRMETIAKNALLCSCRAFDLAGIDIHAPKETGLSVAAGAGSLESTCKFMDSIIDDGDELSSPTAFAGSVHNSTGLTLSVFLHLNGPCVTTGQFDFSFAGALLTAREFLKRGLCREALVAVAEDINPSAALLAPKNPELFAPVLRGPQGPFTRAAAAFVISAEPTENTRFAVTDFHFSCTDAPAAPCSSFPSAAACALETAARLQTGKPFVLRDVFGGVELRLEAEPYVNEKRH